MLTVSLFALVLGLLLFALVADPKGGLSALRSLNMDARPLAYRPAYYAPPRRGRYNPR